MLLKAEGLFSILDIGVAAAFGVLHLLLYLFYPAKRANLYFSLFAVGMVVRIASHDVFEPSGVSAPAASIMAFLANASPALAVFAFVKFLYAAFEEKTPTFFSIAAAAWAVAFAGQSFVPALAERNVPGLLLIAFVTVESLRVIGRALLNRHDGAWIVGLGVILLVLAPLKDALEIFSRTEFGGFWTNLLNQTSIAGILVANSVYLARNFARTNRDLQLQLVQVRELSEREIEHERTAAELRLQNEQEKAKRALIEQEIALAASIQQALFPETIEPIDGYEIAPFNRPAKVCGGDYYDVLKIDDGSHLLCVADVSGKGLPAALLMSNMQANLRALAGRTSSLAELAGLIGGLIFDASPSNKFITAIFLKIDVAAGRASYVNAGHNECMLFGNGGGIALKSTGVPLGMLGGMSYDEVELRFEKGDVIALYSDGVSEAQNMNEEEWGEDNLNSMLERTRNEAPQRIVEKILKSVDAFVGDAPQHDDITMLVIKRSTENGNR